MPDVRCAATTCFLGDSFKGFLRVPFRAALGCHSCMSETVGRFFARGTITSADGFRRPKFVKPPFTYSLGFRV